MKWKRKALSLAATALLLTSLSACGTTDVSKDTPKEKVTGSQPNDTVGKVNPSGNTGIAAGKLVASITDTPKDGKHTYTLEVQNNKEKEETLTFGSSQQYDYQIKDENGKVLYTYSALRNFAQMISEKILKPGEIITFPLEMDEAIASLPNGSYTIDAWLTAKTSEIEPISTNMELRVEKP